MEPGLGARAGEGQFRASLSGPPIWPKPNGVGPSCATPLPGRTSPRPWSYRLTVTADIGTVRWRYLDRPDAHAAHSQMRGIRPVTSAGSTLCPNIPAKPRERPGSTLPNGVLRDDVNPYYPRGGDIHLRGSAPIHPALEQSHGPDGIAPICGGGP